MSFALIAVALAAVFVAGTSASASSILESTTQFFGLTSADQSGQVLISGPKSDSSVTSDGTQAAFGFATPTTTTVSSSANPSTFGDNVTFTATISPIPTVPRGAVDFVIDGNLICQTVLVDASGQATCSLATLNVAGSPHTVRADYSGSPAFDPSTGNLTPGQTVNQATSSTVIDCSPGTFQYTGIALTPCVATVTGPGGLNTTTAVIYTNNLNVGTATANASYAGDPDHSGSVATQVTFSIIPATTVTVIDCAPGTFVYTGSPITPCTANVTGGGLMTTVPVTYGNNTNVGTATADASYPGDSNHAPSTATQATFSITPATSSTTINCAPGSFTYTGSPITPCTATVTGAGGLNTTVPVVYGNNTLIGTATADASYPGDANHSPSTATQATFLITSTACVSAPAGLVSWYSGEGNTADRLGANNGSAVGGLGYTAGRVGQAFDMNGTNADVFIPDSASLNVGTAAGITVDAWIKPTNVTTMQPIVEWNNGSNGGFGVHMWQSVTFGGAQAPADIFVNMRDTNNINHAFYSNPNVLIQNQWNFVAFTFNNTTGEGRIYLNGSPIQVGSNGLPPSAMSVNLFTDFGSSFVPQTGTNYDVYLGHRPADGLEYFSGQMDEVEIFGQVVSPGDISAIYGAFSNGKCVTATTTTVSSSANPSVYGDNVTFTATVSPVPTGGTIQFNIDGMDVGAPVPVDGMGQATYSTSTLDVPGSPHSVTATYSSFLPYAASSGSLTPGQTVNLAPSTTVVTCPVSVVYNGMAQTPCAVVVSGAGGLLLNPAPNYANNTNAGTATASYTYAGDANHSGSSDSEDFQILKAASSTVIDCSPGTFVYTGSAIEPCTATVTGDGGLMTTVPVTYGNNLNVGTATADAMYGGDSNHDPSTATQVTFQITKATTTTTVVFEPAPYTYRGTAFTATATVTGVGTQSFTDNVPVVYSGDCINVTVPNGCTATATYLGDSNHTGSMDSQSITITKANAFCSVTGYSVNYDGLPHTATGSCTGVLMETLTGLSLTGTTHTLPGSYPMDPWTYTDVTGNYNDANGTVADTIGLCPDISVPDINTQTGVPVTVPVNSTILPPTPIIATDFTFTYNPAIISMNPNPLVITVTPGPLLSGSAVITVNKTTPGTVVVGISDPGFTQGAAGALVYLHFDVIGSIGQSTPLDVSNFQFNGGTVCSGTPDDGVLTIISGTTAGKVIYVNSPIPNYGVPGAFINATGPMMPTISDTSDALGDYSLSGFGVGPYTVNISKPSYVGGMSNPFNGIFSNDSVLIAQAVVGMITLTPNQEAAAKVSGLPFLSSFDAALISQWTVGVSNPMNQTGQWKFSPTTTMPDVTLNNTQNYNAILMGDVNGDWDAMLGPRPALRDPERIRNAVQVSTADLTAPAGSTVIVPVRLDNLRGKAVTSYQFDVTFDPNVMTPAAVAADLSETIGAGLAIAVNSPEKGVLKVVVYGAMPVYGEGVYANLRFVVNGGAGSHSPITISNFRFNDGKDDTFVTDGAIRVTKAVGGTPSTATEQ